MIRIETMKEILFSTLLLFVTTISICAQKVDFTTYDIVAKAGDVTVIMKDNDYRMIVGPVERPKLNMLMGYSKEQALKRIEQLLDFSNENYTKNERNVTFVESCLDLRLKEMERTKSTISKWLAVKVTLKFLQMIVLLSK